MDCSQNCVNPAWYAKYQPITNPKKIKRNRNTLNARDFSNISSSTLYSLLYILKAGLYPNIQAKSAASESIDTINKRSFSVSCESSI